jgi:uncharacterized Zn finger protein
MAKRHAAQVAKKQRREPQPVIIEGRKLATTFWGQAWCANLEAYSDFANRLPRGATYVRNGSVVDLVIKPRLVESIVAGSEPYTVKITIEPLSKASWTRIKNDCSASIDSLLDLLAGRISDGVMQRLTSQKDGLFPAPSEIKMKCSCPDYSTCCKHLAAVMYGIGNRLDSQPELLFLLRQVDYQELATQAIAAGNLDRELTAAKDSSLAGADLGAMFGIELDSAAAPPPNQPPKTKRKRAVPPKIAEASSAVRSKKKTSARQRVTAKRSPKCK